MPRRRAAAAALALAALAAASPAAPAAAPDDLRWVRGVNYVPSTSHNDVATFQDYNATLVEAELAFAAASGFNAVRVFLSTLPWLYDAAAFRGRLTHLVATLEALGLTSQLVLFDSCFGAETANVSWITSGAYKNASWIPNPGPAIVANESAWAQYDAYIADVASIAGASRAVLVYDLHNEPDFNVPRMVDFIRHVGEVLQAIEGAAARPRTVGIAYSSQQGLVQDVVTLLSFHNYDGGGGGLGLARDIAGQRALADASKRALLLTETMARPTDLLTSVLPAVSGCINVSSFAPFERSAASAVGFFVWELMLGVDQFNHDWSAPYQGMVYPNWAPAGLGGTFRYPDELALLRSYFANASAACPQPPNGSLVPDTSPAWAWAPAAAWTAWSGAGPETGTLHYANEGGAVATLAGAAGGAAAAALVLVHKRGPDCGLFSVALDGAVVVAAYDSFSPDVDWAAELRVPLAAPGAEWVLDVTAAGAKNASSSNTYVQIVGVRVEMATAEQGRAGGGRWGR